MAPHQGTLTNRPYIQATEGNNYLYPGLNWGPSACKADVITTRPYKRHDAETREVTSNTALCPQYKVRHPGLEPGPPAWKAGILTTGPIALSSSAFFGYKYGSV